MKAGRCERRRSELTERSEVSESFIYIMVRFCAPLFNSRMEQCFLASVVCFGEKWLYGCGEKGLEM